MKSSASVANRAYRMRARAESAQATAQRVLDCAVELFTEKPFEAVSLEEIADQARVAKRTVQRRFGSKEALFVTAMEHAADEMMQHRDAAPVGDIVAAVSSVVDHYERWGTNRLRLVSQEDRIPVVAKNVEGGRRYHGSWVKRTFAPLLDGLTPAAKERRVAVLIALTDVHTWKVLRRDLGLSRSATEQALVETISNLKGES